MKKAYTADLWFHSDSLSCIFVCSQTKDIDCWSGSLVGIEVLKGRLHIRLNAESEEQAKEKAKKMIADFCNKIKNKFKNL